MNNLEIKENILYLWESEKNLVNQEETWWGGKCKKGGNFKEKNSITN